jgi:hypothetical protein
MPESLVMVLCPSEGSTAPTDSGFGDGIRKALGVKRLKLEGHFAAGSELGMSLTTSTAVHTASAHFIGSLGSSLA